MDFITRITLFNTYLLFNGLHAAITFKIQSHCQGNFIRTILSVLMSRILIIAEISISKIPDIGFDRPSKLVNMGAEKYLLTQGFIFEFNLSFLTRISLGTESNLIEAYFNLW
jgi:hypothetical protein